MHVIYQEANINKYLKLQAVSFTLKLQNNEISNWFCYYSLIPLTYMCVIVQTSKRMYFINSFDIIGYNL